MRPSRLMINPLLRSEALLGALVLEVNSLGSRLIVMGRGPYLDLPWPFAVFSGDVSTYPFSGLVSELFLHKDYRVGFCHESRCGAPFFRLRSFAPVYFRDLCV